MNDKKTFAIQAQPITLTVVAKQCFREKNGKRKIQHMGREALVGSRGL